MMPRAAQGRMGANTDPLQLGTFDPHPNPPPAWGRELQGDTIFTHSPATREGTNSTPSPSQGEGRDGGAAVNFSAITDKTPLRLVNTSLFQKRRTCQPCACKKAVLCASYT